MPSAIFNAGRHKPEAYFGSLDALSSWLHQYEPRTITLALWLRIRSFVIAAVLEMAPQHRYEAYQGTHFLAEHTAWCLLQGIPLDRERVLHPDAVERSVSASGRSVHDKGSYRFYLSKYGRALTRHAPWPPPKERIPYAGLVPPYPPSQLSALRRAARSQTPLQNRRSTALIAMCAGAGLDGRSAADVKANDVEQLARGLAIRVGGRRPRTVPVLAAFDEDLLWVVRQVRAGPLLDGLPCKRVTGPFRVPGGVPPLSTHRLRSTWLATQLELRTRLPELLEAAGLRTATDLHGLFGALEDLPPQEVAAMLQGRRDV